MKPGRQGPLRSTFGSLSSVRGKLTVVVLATTAVALLTMTLALLHRDLSGYRESLAADLATEAAIMAQLTSAAMDFDDQSAAERNLAALRAKPTVLAAGLYSPYGNLYAQYVRDGAQSPPAMLQIPAPALQTPEGRMEVTRVVYQKENPVGIIYLSARYEVWDHVYAYLRILGLMMVLSMGVALALSAGLRRTITGPVDALAAVADDIVSGRNATRRAADSPLEEFSMVARAFNSVLDETDARNRDLQNSTRALREADRRKDDFLATLAHELRNPLAPIRHAAKLLGIKGLDEAQAQTAREIISRQVARMALLLDDLLEVSRITRGRLELRKQRVALSSVVRTAVETSKPLLDSKKHEFSMRMPDLPVELFVDPLRISQALSNLLTNAAKYTDPGGRIELEIQRSGRELILSVKDSGVGVPASALPTIFEMFSQVDSVIDRAEGGLGIGLALVKGLVALHGGTVQAASDGPGKGSTFTIRLPADLILDASASEQVRPPQEHHAGPRGRILVVDDNRDAASSLAMVLRSAGHMAITANSGEQALEIASLQALDAIVLDIGMPHMNGYEVAQRIRESSWGKGMLLLALTGWGQKEDIERAIAAGFDMHMTKPADPEHIEGLLEDFLRSQAARIGTETQVSRP